MKNLLVFATLCCSIHLFAGVEAPLQKQLSGTAFLPYPGNTPTLTLPVNLITTPTPFNANNSSWSAGFKIKAVTNLVKLYSNPNSTTFINFDYELSVPIKITYFKDGNPAVFVLNETLRITYDPNVTNHREYQQTEAFRFIDGCQVDVEVQNGIVANRLNNNVALTPAEMTLLAKTVFLQSEITVERYFDFDPLLMLSPPDFAATNVITATNELEIKWSKMVGAEEYDLEWIFVDDYNGIGSYLPANSLKYDFNLNAARVQIKENIYRIPLVYEHGYLLYRVRGIGRNPADNFVSPVVGTWSCAASNSSACNTSAGTVSNYLTRRAINLPHENDQKNWQAVTTYAEEGKRKTVISYLDGTLRNRQSVTGLSSDQMTLVGQTIYDFQGRAAIQVVPAPVNNARLRYYANFNQNMAGQPYSRSDFDLTDANCDNDAGQMLPNNSGASNYYSAFNPNKTGFNAYLPSAENYPFTHTEYTPDNTGRIARQGGVGLAHQLNKAHETKYFYVVPDQEELDLLFGNEAGFARHYKKNAVIDANGQLSLTYLDAKGNTIATALAGNPPTSLDDKGNPYPILEPLASYQPVSMTIDLLAHNRIDDEHFALIMEKTEMVNTVSDYVFNYTFKPEKIDYSDCDGTKYCLDCVYDLEFLVIDNLNCNDTVFRRVDKIGTLFDTQGNISLQCDPLSNPSNAWVPSTFTVYQLPVGSYTFAKRLLVNEAAADAYVLAVLDTCPALFNTILQQQYALMDTTGCEIGCKETIADQSNSTYFNQLTPEQQQQLTQLSVDLCDSISLSSCEAAYEAMLADVSPGGQYGTINSSDPMQMMVSVFAAGQLTGNAQILTGNYQNVVFKNEDGSTFTPVDAQDLEDNWRPEWAELLLPFHPEYCYYKFCVDYMEGSDRYNARLQTTQSLQAALAANFIGVPTAIMSNDPFFSTTTFNAIGSLAASYVSDMNTALIINNFKGSGRSMKQLALEAANYPNGTNGNWSSNPVMADKEWAIYRTFYLTYKEELYYKIRTAYAIQNNCYNECIGDDNFNPYLNGFPNYFGLGSGTGLGWTTPQRNCDSWGYLFLKSKTKRFPSVYDILPDDFPFDFFNGNAPAIFNYLYDQSNVQKQDVCCDTLAKELPDFLTALVLANKPSFVLDLTANNAFPNGLEGFLLNGATTMNGSYFLNPTVGRVIINFGPGLHPCGRLTFLIPPQFLNDIAGFCCFQQLGTSSAWPGVAFRMTATTKNGTQFSVDGTFNEQCQIWCRPKALPCADQPAKAELLALFDYLIYQKQISTGPIIVPEAVVGPNLKARFGNTTGDFTWNPFSNSPLKLDATLKRGNFFCKFSFDLSAAVNWPAVIKVESIQPDASKMDAQGRIRHFTLRLWGTTAVVTGFTDCFVLSDCCLPNEPAGACKTCPPIFAGKPDSLTILGTIGAANCNPYCDTTAAVLWPIINPCVQQQIDLAEHHAQQIYLDSMLQLRDELKALYMERCLQAAEQFNVTFTDARHHFTLYYYDQANNLVETIPPAGVVPLNPAQMAQVLAYRKGTSPTPVFAVHNLPSRYRHNSLNQLTWQKIPDHAAEDLFFYDGLGRLVASINAKQRPAQFSITRTFSYTRYDALGRIIEVGENKRNVSPSNNFTSFLNTLTAKALDYLNWDAFVNVGTRTEITRTEYDQTTPALAALFPNGKQENLRGRVAAITWLPKVNAAPNEMSQFWYSYDIHGNVKTLVQHSFDLDNKTVEYAYDLVSGKVNSLAYQRGQADQFHHEYRYDADNRLIEVRTSPDAVLWDVEARYKYYKHGPLARVEIGDDQVQGLDYAYTLHGWIKGVNSGSLQAQHDMGKDGQNAGSGNFARDAIGYLLGYYDDDHISIGASSFESGYAGSNLINRTFAPSLYNGNIRNMVTAIEPFMANGKPLATMYHYDQLNRLMQVTPDQDNFDVTNNRWLGGSPDKRWTNSFTYDPNGNILTQERNGDNQAALEMDRLKYEYYPNTNQLQRVSDQLALSGNYAEDIDNQALSINYIYDALGNLVKDGAENQIIQWNLSGKVSKIVDSDAPAKTITFGYNPMGKRAVKTVNGESTYHAYDASGNVLATYRRSSSSGQTILESAWLYGSSRLGEYRAEKCLIVCPRPFVQPDHFTRIRGKRRYEESNHLGNVLAVVSDRKIPVATGNVVTAFTADVVSAGDYYAFGMEMVGRTLAGGRYGFNGKENDNEVKGITGSQLDFGERIYDSRIGRWLSLDPLASKHANESPYNYVLNNPIYLIDKGGETEDVYLTFTDKTGKKLKIHMVDADKVLKVTYYTSIKLGPEDYTGFYSTKEYNTIYTANFQQQDDGTFKMTTSDLITIDPNSGITAKPHGGGYIEADFGDGKAIAIEDLVALAGGGKMGVKGNGVGATISPLFSKTGKAIFSFLNDFYKLWKQSEKLASKAGIQYDPNKKEVPDKEVLKAGNPDSTFNKKTGKNIPKVEGIDTLETLKE